MRTRTKKHVTYYFTPQMLEDISHYSKLVNRSNTNFVETAIIEYIEKHWPGSAGTQPGRELTIKASKEPGV